MHNANHTPGGAVVLLVVCTEDLDGAATDARDTADHVDCRAFTGTVRPKQTEYFSGLDRKRDVVDGDGTVELFREVMNGKGWSRHGVSSYAVARNDCQGLSSATIDITPCWG